KANVDDDLEIGQVMAEIDTSASKPAEGAQPVATTAPKEEKTPVKEEPKKEKAQPPVEKTAEVTEEVKKPEVIKPRPAEPAVAPAAASEKATAQSHPKATPLAAAIIADKKVDVSTAKGTGSFGKLTKNDVLSILQHPGRKVGEELFSRN